MLVGAVGDADGGTAAGAAYVLYGPVSGTVSLGIADLKLTGAEARAGAGVSVASVPAGGLSGAGISVDGLLIGGAGTVVQGDQWSADQTTAGGASLLFALGL